MKKEKSPEQRIEELESQVEALNDEIAKINGGLGALEGLQKSANSPNQFMVLALFKFGPKPPKEIAELQNGGARGLPSLILHRWCQLEPCGRVNSNLYARKPPLKDLTEAIFKWDYVGGRIFSTRVEADMWLANSREGHLFTKYADVVMAVSLTYYGIL
jgi:hypothetical protein